MARVVLDHVTRRFGQFAAIDDFSLEVEDKEFLVLLGPSGCGKSTALRLIAGLDDPTEGSISIGDRVVDGIEPRDRDIAMVFQSYALYPHMTARQNMEFPLKKRGVAEAERANLVAEAAEALGLVDILDRRPAQMSGGQRQRVALGRAIVRRPAVFLMDEPLSNLDAQLRVQTRAELVELHRRLSTTFIYVTHDQVEAMTMGSRIAVMNAGALQQLGPPQEVYDRPENTFVARFIGSPPMNLVRARIVRDDGSVALRVDEASLPLAPSAAAALDGAADVDLGVRPEHLVLDGGPLRAKVKVVESLGHERQIVCDLSGGARVITRIPAEESAPPPGAQVGLSIAPGRLHLFDSTSGARLN
ncbi:MAG: sn-glycerol-3-phosphate ABC transporter ATP-binding protein UgpC [Dehalococcoidia bacterium]|nr:sn-glycerol-3-phosphate ABC transporter ATP-binding protein UgpC [Dehalococcoidia bacterium]